MQNSAQNASASRPPVTQIHTSAQRGKLSSLHVYESSLPLAAGAAGGGGCSFDGGDGAIGW